MFVGLGLLNFERDNLKGFTSEKVNYSSIIYSFDNVVELIHVYCKPNLYIFREICIKLVKVLKI